MKERQTLQEKLEQRKIKKPGFMYWLLGGIWKLLFLKKYNVHYDFKINVKKIKGPYIVVSNHASRLDYIYSGLAFYPQKLNFVAGYNEFFRSHLQGVFKLLRVIPKRNFVSDVHTVKEILRVIKSGGNIMIYPEGMSSIGGGNQPCAIGSGKLIKHCNVPVYITKIKGGYLTNTKYCLDERIGRVDVEVDQLFTIEDIQNLTADEIQEKLDIAIKHNDYDWNKEQRIKFDGKGRMAHNLHHLLYWCPKCGRELTMKGHDNIIECTHCHNKATLNEYYDLIPNDDTCIIPNTPSKWFDLERARVRELVKDEKFTYSDHVKLGVLPEYKYLKNKATSEIVGEGLLTINRKQFIFEGTKNGKQFRLEIDPKNLPTFGMCTDVTFFYTFDGGKYYEFIPDGETTAKWLLSVEEVHRISGGKWQDFKDNN